MSGAEGRANQRLADLAQRAQTMRDKIPWGQVGSLANDQLWEFIVSSLQALRSICGEQSPHYRELERLRETFIAGNPLQLDICIGVMNAAKEDLNNGMLVNLREVIAAEIFDDLLEAAAHLLWAGYHLPAAATAGAVLEDALRRLCVKHSVTWRGNSGINKLNVELYKAGLYGNPQHAQIEAWAKLRNAVDHHNFSDPSEVGEDDVRRMIEGIRDFLIKHLT